MRIRQGDVTKIYIKQGLIILGLAISWSALAQDNPPAATPVAAEPTTAPAVTSTDTATATPIASSSAAEVSSPSSSSATASSAVVASSSTKSTVSSRAPASVKGSSKKSSKGTARTASGLRASKAVQGTKTTVASNGQKTIYQYTKYQKFDFEDMDIGTEGSAPGDLSITGRYQKQFQNKLPYRRNFRPEILEAIERIR
ncbi:MAG: hypothetical protein J6Y94_07005 [Bacteriovoracaceae bacterium]|nr:hypothetical protein [Bacteriovoracaceae bacterium]